MSYKSVTIGGDEGWTIFSGGDADSDVTNFLTRVAWPYRAVQLIGETTSQIPFNLTDPRGNIVDTSTDWGNVFGAWPYPKKDIYRVAASMVALGQAYLKPVRKGNKVSELTYIPADQVKPLHSMDTKQNLVGFMYQNVKYPIEDFIYFWYPDYHVDAQHPPISWPSKAAFSAAGVLFNLDEYTSKYFANGAVRSMLLGVPANTQQTERERIEGYFNKFITGIKNAFRVKTINADDVKPTIIGDGLDALADKDLTNSQREDICVAYGIPKTRLFSDASTNATADADVRSMTLDTALPLLGTIIETFNTQLFARFGLRMVETHESMEIFQQNEAATAAALAQYVGAFNISIPLALAMCPVLGIELPDETIAALDEIMAEQEEEPEPEPQPETVSADDNIDEDLERDETPDEAETETAPAPEPMSDETKRALRNWMRRAEHLYSKGDSNWAAFENEHIPTETHTAITARLAECKGVDDIRRAFGAVEAKQAASAEQIIEMLKLAVEGLKHA